MLDPEKVAAENLSTSSRDTLVRGPYHANPV